MADSNQYFAPSVLMIGPITASAKLSFIVQAEAATLAARIMHHCSPPLASSGDSTIFRSKSFNLNLSF